MIKAVIFDYDGVIVDGDLARFKFFQKAFLESDIKIDDSLYKDTAGKITQDIFDNTFTNIDNNIKQEVLDLYRRDYKNNITKYTISLPVTINFLKDYKGALPLIIATNTDKNLVGKVLKQLNIFYKFSTIISPNSNTKPKPSPDIYLRSLGYLNLESSECIAIEDSVVGVQAASGAGIKCYVFLNGHNDPEEFFNLNTEGVIKDISDYNRVFNKI